jgi:tetratricopeptide (TPR) repeat protein
MKTAARLALLTFVFALATPAFAQTPPSTANDYFKLGNERYAAQDWSGAITAYTKAIELDPRHKIAYYNRAVVRKEQGEVEEALADYNKAIEIDPSYVPPYLNRGVIRQDKKDLDGAIADFSKSIELQPRKPEAYGARGSARKAKADIEGALADYNKAIELDPHYAPAYYDRGQFWLSKQDLDRASADYSKYIELVPTDVDGYNSRGSVRDSRGDFEGAISDYRKAIEVAPKEARAYNNLAWLLATSYQDRVRDGAKAVELATKAAELTKWQDANTLDTLAAAYAEAGNFEEAIKWENKALSFPEFAKNSGEQSRQQLALFMSKKPYHQSPPKQ